MKTLKNANNFTPSQNQKINTVDLYLEVVVRDTSVVSLYIGCSWVSFQAPLKSQIPFTKRFLLSSHKFYRFPSTSVWVRWTASLYCFLMSWKPTGAWKDGQRERKVYSPPLQPHTAPFRSPLCPPPPPTQGGGEREETTATGGR